VVEGGKDTFVNDIQGRLYNFRAAKANDTSVAFIANFRTEGGNPYGLDGIFLAKLDSQPIHFPQIAIGSGYTTLISLVNTGSTEASGELSFWNQQGDPLIVALGDATPLSQSPNPSDPMQLTEISFSLNDVTIGIKLIIVDENGGVVETLEPPEMNPLGPFQQVSRFLHEYAPSTLDFRGSIVIVADDGMQFALTALSQERGVLTAIPVIQGKAQHIHE